MLAVEPTHLWDWINANIDSLKPPVCNKLLHNGQLKVMFVGGPNSRDDYHIEEGEEFFWQFKGNAALPIVERDGHKHVAIPQDFTFLLCPRVPHSPQRDSESIGLVIERDRSPDEIDGLRWYVPGSTDVLWEDFFHCTDLGTQLKPVMERCHASESYKTKVPNLEDGSVRKEVPIVLDVDTTLPDPVNIEEWLASKTAGTHILFEGKDFDVVLLVGAVTAAACLHTRESFYYQKAGCGSVVGDGESVALGEGFAVVTAAGAIHGYKGESSASCCLRLTWET